MKKLKPFTYFLFIFTILFIIFSPGIIQTGLDKDVKAKESEQFTGILTLWQISAWQTDGSSITACVKKCVKDFENHNTYVFIETTALTPAKAAQKILAGEKPDLICFPTGFFSDPSLLLPLDIIGSGPGSINSSASYNGRTYAQPFLINPYLLYVNEELLFEKEIDSSLFGKINYADFLKTAETLSFSKQEGKKQKQVFGLAMQNEYLNSPFAALPFFNERKAASGAEPSAPKSSENTDLKTSLDAASYHIDAALEKGTELFLAKQAGMLLSSAGANIQLKNAKQTPPAYFTVPVSYYSDMVQYIGIVKTDEEKKAEMCKNFVYSLFTDKNIVRLAESGAFPVVYSDELFADDATLKESYGILLQKGVFPNAFSYSALAKNLQNYASGVVKGDKDAGENIRRLIANKLY